MHQNDKGIAVLQNSLSVEDVKSWTRQERSSKVLCNELETLEGFFLSRR